MLFDTPAQTQTVEVHAESAVEEPELSYNG
jgi:hypothetical protein